MLVKRGRVPVWPASWTLGTAVFALLGAALILAAPVAAQDNPSPLRAADTSSPRATFKSFLTACDDVYHRISEKGAKVRSDDRALVAVGQIIRCLDLSEVPPAMQRSLGSESAVCLKEVLDRLDLPPEGEIPDADAMHDESASGEPRRWRIPDTEIVIAEVREGPRRGEFLFSPDTVSRAKEFYERVKHLDYQRPQASRGFYDWYLSEPGWMIPTRWIRALPEWTRRSVYGMTVWQWFGLTLTLAVGISVMFVTYRVGRRQASEKRRLNVFRYCVTLVFPIAAMLVPLLAKYFIVEQLVIRGAAGAAIGIVLDVIFLSTAVVVLYAAGNRIAEIIISSPRIHPKGIDAQFIRLGFRAFSIAGAVIVLLEGGRYLGIPLTTLLAGAGVGGLTVALAAQDTLKNLFGSMMVILDRPFRVGERIVVKSYDGVVEEIGLRSTKIRLLTGHLATIPNEEMARTDVENVGRRPHIRRIQDIALRYDMPSEKVQKAAEIIRNLLEDHEGMKPDFPPRVFFNEFRRDCLNLRVIYWYHPPNYWDFLAHGEKLNVRIMEEFEAAGIQFAMPTTTTFLTQDEQQPLEVGLTAEPGKEGLPKAAGEPR